MAVTTLRPLIAVLIGLAVAAPASAQVKIGFVNTQRILGQSAPAIAAQKRIKSEFSARDRALAQMAKKIKSMQTDLEKNSITMSESARAERQRDLTDLNRDFQRKQREFREDLSQRRNEELGKVVEEANRVIRKIAQDGNYDLILQDAVYADPRIDITDKVIKALAGGKSPAK